MLTIINGPGCPVLSPSTGSRVKASSTRILYPSDVLEQISEILVVEPVCLRHPSSPGAAELREWLPPPAFHPYMTILASPTTAPVCQALGYRVEIIEHYIMGAADVSGLLRRPAKFTRDRIVVVGKYAGLSDADLVTLRQKQGYILCGTYPTFGGGIPRFQVDSPLYWMVSDEGELTAGPVVEGPSGSTILADSPEKLSEQVFRASPGSFRIVSTAVELPDVKTELGKGVLSLSSDPEFAEAAMKDITELSTRHIEALRG